MFLAVDISLLTRQDMTRLHPGERESLGVGCPHGVDDSRESPLWDSTVVGIEDAHPVESGNVQRLCLRHHVGCLVGCCLLQLIRRRGVYRDIIAVRAVFADDTRYAFRHETCIEACEHGLRLIAARRVPFAIGVHPVIGVVGVNLDSDMAWGVVSRDDEVVYDLLLLGSRIGVDDEIAMSYGYVYVAQVAMGANPAQTLKAITEAEAYNGPSLIIGYAPCEMHSIKGGMTIWL